MIPREMVFRKKIRKEAMNRCLRGGVGGVLRIIRERHTDRSYNIKSITINSNTINTNTK